MFSETWLSDSDKLNLDIQGYTCDHLYGNKSAGAKKGRYSGGISIYYKNCLKNKIKIVEKIQSGILWVKIQGELFLFKEDVYICNLYNPPSNSKVLNQDVDIYEVLEQGVLRYKNLGKVYITGDFNGRTASEADILDFDKYIDDEAFSDFIHNDSITTRINQDDVIDSYGRRLLLFCQMTNLFIANGRLGDFHNTSGVHFRLS